MEAQWEVFVERTERWVVRIDANTSTEAQELFKKRGIRDVHHHVHDEFISGDDKIISVLPEGYTFS